MKRVCITGINSGLGNLLMKRCIAEGYFVTGTVRSTSDRKRLNLEFKHSINQLEIHVCDLSQPKQVTKLIAKLRKGTPFFDYVVLNAGCADYNWFHENTDESLRKVMETNLITNMRLLRSLIPRAQKNETKFVYISSLAAHLPGKKYASYCASKAGLSSLYSTLAVEYPEIPQLCVEIGATETGFHRKINMQKTKAFRDPRIVVDKLFTAMHKKTGVTTLMADWSLMRSIGRLFLRQIMWVARRAKK